MNKFRLKMSRQLGEKTAKDHGFETFPIDPFCIAEENEIIVEAKSPEKPGASGCIVFNNDGVGIIYSTSINNEGFINFTVAHELGHYFIDGHPEEICKAGGKHYSEAGFERGDTSIEIEADHFASGLLLPTHLVKSELLNSTIGLDGILSLAEKARCSITAAAIRASECAPYPIAIVVSQGEFISYCFLSENFKSLKPSIFYRNGDYLPSTETRIFNKQHELVLGCKRTCNETSYSEWFGSNRQLKLDEEIIGLGKYGLTLTILSSELLDEDPMEYDDDDDSLEEIWKPKFAYGR